MGRAGARQPPAGRGPAQLKARGIPVHDSDATVHDLYQAGGEAVDAIAAIAPEAVTAGDVDRAILARLVLADPGLMKPFSPHR